MLSQLVWVHIRSCSVESRKYCFLSAIHHPWLLQSFYHFFHQDPWALEKEVWYLGMRISLFFFFNSLPIGQLKGFVLVAIYSKKMKMYETKCENGCEIYRCSNKFPTPNLTRYDHWYIHRSMKGMGVTNHLRTGPKACSMTSNPAMLPTMLKGTRKVDI